MPPSSHLAHESSSETKSNVKVNTAKRVEGRFSYDRVEDKIDLRFATDLAEIGAPVKN